MNVPNIPGMSYAYYHQKAMGNIAKPGTYTSHDSDKETKSKPKKRTDSLEISDASRRAYELSQSVE